MYREYTIVIAEDEDGYFVGSVPALPGCHTRARPVDRLLERMREAMEVWMEDEGDACERVPSAS